MNFETSLLFTVAIILFSTASTALVLGALFLSIYISKVLRERKQVQAAAGADSK